MCKVIKDSHPELYEFGIDFIENGADIHRDLKPPPKTQEPYVIKNKLLRELASKHLIDQYNKKRFLGPFNPDEVPEGTYVNAVFVKEKDLSRKKILFLINYSAPKPISINSEIPKKFTTLQYPTLLQNVKKAKEVGPNGYLSVLDLKNCYYNLFLNKKYCKILAIHWQGKILLPCFQPFGIATGCRTLQKVLDVVQEALRILFPKIFKPNGLNMSDHYLDDKVAFHYNIWGNYLQSTIWIMIVAGMGLPFGINKIQLPRKIADLLGFTFNLSLQTYKLIDKKAKKYLKYVWMLIKFYKKGTINKSQKIIGRLRHAGKAVQGGPAFVRGLEEQMHKFIALGYPNNKFYTYNDESMHDLYFWAEALNKFNGIPFDYLLKSKDKIDNFLFSDASANPNLGFGIWDTLGNWCAIKWNKTKLFKIVKKEKIHINELEFISFAIGFLALAEFYENKTICIKADNFTAVMWYIKKAPSFKNKFHKFISFLIRKMVLKCLDKRIYLWIEYIDTNNNKIADHLSRFKKKPFENKQKGIKELPRFKTTFNPIKLLNKLVTKFAYLFN